MGTLHEDQYTFMILSRSIRVRMKNVTGKRCRENQNTYFMFNNTQQLYVLPTQCIYVFCMDLRTNSDYFPIQQ